MTLFVCFVIVLFFSLYGGLGGGIYGLLPDDPLTFLLWTVYFGLIILVVCIYHFADDDDDKK